MSLFYRHVWGQVIVDERNRPNTIGAASQPKWVHTIHPQAQPQVSSFSSKFRPSGIDVFPGWAVRWYSPLPILTTMRRMPIH
jgi:hypothetical protein